MSTDTHADPSAHVDPVTGEYTGPMFDGHDLVYIKVFVALVVLTAVEVALSYSGLKHASLATFLLSLAAIKFVVVAGFFMHLKFDTPLFRRLFVGGGILAGFCYFAMMSAMGALRTPRALLPIHWWVYIVGAIVFLAVWVVPRGLAGDDDELDHADHDHSDHAHAH